MPETVAVRLDAWLSACAKATDLREGMVSPVHVSFRHEVASDSELQELIKERLKAIDPGVLRRDHLSRWLKATLEGALPK